MWATWSDYARPAALLFLLLFLLLLLFGAAA